MNTIDYSTVTEVTGYRVTSEQIRRMYNRYRFATEFCREKEVLEVACGSGQGLGYLAQYAKKVVGGDYDICLVDHAKTHYKDRIEIKHLDAHDLPFQDNTFDVVILFEAIYYLTHPEKFINEAKRVLRKDGKLIIGSANKEWSDFNPSPFSHSYFSAAELDKLLQDKDFHVQIYADCPVELTGFQDRVLSCIKQIAIKYNLIPKTMKGKELLKRIFMGRLIKLPPEIIDGLAEYIPPVPISSKNIISQYKVIFAVAQKKVI